MPLPLNEIKKLIKESIPDAKIEIRDLMGDNNHYSAKIQSKMFNNLNKIYKTTIEEENIEELQRQKSIIEILLSKNEALYLLNKVEEKKDKEKTNPILS